MSTPVLTFFSNKGGAWKTSLVYHVAWMLSRLGRPVLAADLDPQARLTAAFLREEELERLWERSPDEGAGRTIFQCIEPLTEAGDIRAPRLHRIDDGLHLLPGDVALSGLEERLSTEWTHCLGKQNLHRPFRVVTSLWQALQQGARQCGADLVLVDIGPGLGAVNRSALVASDFVLVSLGADVLSLHGLRSLGPALRRWRDDWARRRGHWGEPAFDLPAGHMQPIGYLIQQHGVRLSRPIVARDRWVKQMPAEYRRSVLGAEPESPPPALETDGNRITTVKHFRSLIPLGQEAGKPIFDLTPGDGAMGSYAAAASEAFHDFREMAQEILRRTGAGPEGARLPGQEAPHQP